MTIELKDNERIIIDRVIDDIILSIDDLEFNLGSHKCWHGEPNSNCLHLETDLKLLNEVDIAISVGVTKLRQELRVDFFEKLAFRTMSRAETASNYKPMAVMAVRLFDAMPFIVALSKKWRGKPYISTIDAKAAKLELKARKLL